MKVRELIEELRKHDPERVVIMSQDAEGNGYNPLNDIETGLYHEGEVGLEELTPELIKKGYSKEDLLKGECALIFWPSHG